jgi:signal transduction histidine kinase
MALTFAVSSATHPQRLTAPIVVGDATVGDGPQVVSGIRERIAKDELVAPTDVNPGNVVGSLLALAWLATGSLILTRQPRNLAGWIFTAIGVAWFVDAFAIAVTVWSLVQAVDLPLRGGFAVLGEVSLLPLLFLPLLFLLFPDGHPPPRFRWAMWLIFVGLGISVVGSVTGPGPLNNFVDGGIAYVNPIGVAALEPVAGPLTFLGMLAIITASLATVPAVWGRYRGSSGEERQQLRWLVRVATLAGSLLVLAILVTITGELLTGLGDLPLFPIVGLAFLLTVVLGVPAAYLIAIFRYGLWNLDVVIRKTRVALLLTFVIVLPTVLLVAIAAQVFMWRWAPKPIALVGGILIGLLLVPLVARERRLARRITYGRRASGYEVLTSFGEHVGESYSIDDVAPRMVRVLADATGATSARVLLRVGARTREIASFGRAKGDEHAFPVIDRGEELGSLRVTFPPGDPIDATKEKLTRDLASHAGLVLRNVRLIEELRASRQRLVAAQDEERRKLERDIHDGVQQQLVAVQVQLRLARTMMERDPARAGAILEALQEISAEALEDLRDLARGIYPPLLEDKGLTAALESQARKAAVPTKVESDGIGRYPREIESAVYFCSLEALNNVAKYAGATAATITLSQTDGHLTFTVADDGRGFDPSVTAHGTGLQGMADRLDAIGGSLEVRSAPDEGTSVIGRVPSGEVDPA